MFGRLGIAVLVGLTLSGTLRAQEWAQKMFKVTEHNFGVVARGSAPEFAFEFSNLYEEDVEIAEVRSNCGCTTPRLTKQRLKTWEKASVITALNTRSFLGAKTATVTVVLTKPFPAEVQLTVRGVIRGDVVIDPHTVAFGEVDEGTTVERRLQIIYAGRASWRVVDIRSANQHLEVELGELQRREGRVIYDMLVRLKPTAPTGYLHDELTIVTDDPQARIISLPVEGKVRSSLTISPATIYLGSLRRGESASRKLVVRGKEPFRVLRVESDDCFQIEPSLEAKRTHLIPVTFSAGPETGNLVRKIRIVTDLGQGLEATCTATVSVAP